MGFLKRVIKNKLTDVVTDEVNDALDGTVDGLKKLLKTDRVQNEPEEEAAPAPAQAQKRFCTNCGAQLQEGAAFCMSCGTKVGAPAAGAAAAAPALDDDLNARFESIFAANFPEYEVKKEAEAASLGIAAPAVCRPYTYALCKGGEAKVLIMLTPHNRDNNAAYKNAKAAAGEAGLPFLNFYTHYDNERGYIINRIQKNL